MALFKVSKGASGALNNQALNDGFCWFTYDDGKFYIDYKDPTDNVVKRKALSADKADKDNLGNILQNTYAANLNLSGHTLKLIAKDGTTVLATITLPDNNTTYTLSGALSGETFVTTLTPSSGSATTATVPKMTAATASAAGAAGLVPAPGSGAQTKYLRGDGTWAVPSNTDTLVTQNNTTTSAAYRVLLSFSATNDSETKTVYKSGNLQYNPSTNKLSTGNLDLTGALTVTGNATFNSQTTADSLTAGSLITNGNAVFNNEVAIKNKVTLGTSGGYNISADGSEYSGNAASATKLKTARTINGTNFDGSGNITTSSWGAARNISISDSDGTNTGAAVSVNGSAAATLKLPATIKASLTGNASSATKATQDGDGNVISSTYLKLSGGTMTGRLTADKGFVNLLTGTGVAGKDNGSSDTSTRYQPAKWTFNTGVTVADGDIFTIKIPVAGHDYGVFMSIDNGTSYYPIVLNGTGRLTTHYPVNTYITVVFESTGSAASIFALNGGMSRTTVSNGAFRVINYYDSNSDYGYYARKIYSNIKAGSNKIYPYSLIMQNSDGRWESLAITNPGTGNSHAANTHGFLINEVYVMYANATYSENQNVGTYNVYSAHSNLIDVRYSFNLTSSAGFTGYKPVYIVGTIGADGLFYLDTTKWWAQTLPTTDDGKVYVHIGNAYDWYRLTLNENKYSYFYRDNRIQMYAPGRGIKTITRSGTTFTGTRDDGSTFTFTQQDNNTTYSFADGTAGNFTVTPSGGSAQTVSIGKPATAGTADHVAWSGITDKPSSFTPSSHSHGNITNAGELGTASRAVITDGNKKVTVSSVTSTELGYLSGVTSAIQTQLNAKAPLASPALTGTPTAPTAAAGTNNTQLATTAFVMNAFAANDAMIFKGTIAGGSTGNYGALTPAAERGHTYKVSASGAINGVWVEIGDILICTTDSTEAATSSNYSTIKNNWAVIQNNVDGAVFMGHAGSVIGGATQPVYVKANGEVTAGTALKALAYKDSISYTPAGTIANTSITPAGTISSTSITPAGTNAKSAVTIKATTTDVYSMTSAGSKTDGTAASLTMSVTDEVLSFSWTPNVPTAVTLPGRSSVIKAWTGYTTGVDNTYAAAQVFTGTAASHDHTFTGTAASHNHTFTGTAATLS